MSEVPVDWTPQIRDGSVRAIERVGDLVVAGGDFTTVRRAGYMTDMDRPGLVVFRFGTTEVLSTRFEVKGRVEALTAGVEPDTFWAGGSLSEINGVKGRLFLLNARTGEVVPSFAVAKIDRSVTDLAVVGKRLLVSGTFKKINGKRRKGLASFNARTGRLSKYLKVPVTGSRGNSPIGVTEFDVSPDQLSLAVIGHFKSVAKVVRPQVAVIDLGTESASLRTSWSTSTYKPECNSAWPSYVREVRFSEDGQAIFVAATGGYGYACDGLTKLRVSGVRGSIKPDWVMSTGGDTVWGLETLGEAAYVGGHQRWFNNPLQANSNGRGSVPRAGLGAVNSANGVPTRWNPGRSPRGVAVFTMAGSKEGLFVGSDTEYVGNYEFFRPRLAFFPATTQKPAATGLDRLPGEFYRLTGGPRWEKTLAQQTSMSSLSSRRTELKRSEARGATVIGDVLFYGSPDGKLHKRAWRDGAVGADKVVNPYTGNRWRSIRTGWTFDNGEKQTYAGRQPVISTKMSRMKGLAYSKGQVYFTLRGDSNLYSAGFDPVSGIIKQVQSGAVGEVAGTGLRDPGEIEIVGDDLFYVDGSNGRLLQVKVPSGGRVGKTKVVSGPDVDGRDWRTRALVIGPRGADSAPLPDDEAPGTRITGGSSGVVDGRVIQFSFKSNMSGARFTCKLDKQSWRRCASPKVYRKVAKGSHVFQVRAHRAGLVDRSPAVKRFKVAKRIRVEVKAKKRASRLWINVNPNKRTKNYQLLVQRKSAKGWRTVRKTRTRGVKDVRTIKPGKGSYRVVVPAQHGMLSTASSKVRLRR